jgi:hypothetical protein
MPIQANTPNMQKMGAKPPNFQNMPGMPPVGPMPMNMANGQMAVNGMMFNPMMMNPPPGTFPMQNPFQKLFQQQSFKDFYKKNTKKIIKFNLNPTFLYLLQEYFKVDVVSMVHKKIVEEF